MRYVLAMNRQTILAEALVLLKKLKKQPCKRKDLLFWNFVGTSLAYQTTLKALSYLQAAHAIEEDSEGNLRLTAAASRVQERLERALL